MFPLNASDTRITKPVVILGTLLTSEVGSSTSLKLPSKTYENSYGKTYGNSYSKSNKFNLFGSYRFKAPLAL